MVPQAAGGASFDGCGSLLDQKIESTSARSVICVGSSQLVEQSKDALMECLDTMS